MASFQKGRWTRWWIVVYYIVFITLFLHLSLTGEYLKRFLVKQKNAIWPDTPALVPLSQTERDYLYQRTYDQMIFIEGGTFDMGDVGYTTYSGEFRRFTNDKDTLPVHQVTLANYSLQKYEVTITEVTRFLKATSGRRLEDGVSIGNEAFDLPLIANAPAAVEWHIANNYCIWLGEKLGQPIALVTEAQWEYAARNRGKVVAHATDNGELDWGKNIGGTQQQVGRWPPNPLGLYDMSGNLGEWVYDAYALYKNTPRNDSKTIDFQGSSSSIDNRVRIVRGIVFEKRISTNFRRYQHSPLNLTAFRCALHSPSPMSEPTKRLDSETYQAISRQWYEAAYHHHDRVEDMDKTP